MSMQGGLWGGAGAAFVLAVTAGVADWRRSRRKELDDPGWVPWRGIQAASLFAVVLLAGLALHG